MIVVFTEHFGRALQKAPQRVQRDFGKQIGNLLRNPAHPSLRTKKYDEPQGIWQARVNDDWRLYFLIEDNTYKLLDIIPHPK